MVAVSGFVFVGPSVLFMPHSAPIHFGTAAWLFIVALFGLCVLTVVLTSGPRLVVYNITAERLRQILATAAPRLDSQARWAGDGLALPGLGVQLRLESSAATRHMALIATGNRQNIEAWRRLERTLAKELPQVAPASNPNALLLFLVAGVLMAVSITYMLVWPVELAQGMREMLML